MNRVWLHICQQPQRTREWVSGGVNSQPSVLRAHEVVRRVACSRLPHRKALLFEVLTFSMKKDYVLSTLWLYDLISNYVQLFIIYYCTVCWTENSLRESIMS